MFEQIDEPIKYLVTLISIINPIGVIPIFLSLTQDASKEEIKKIASSCSLAVAVTIIISLILGKYILLLFQISIPSFTIGGGIMLFSMAFGMISAKTSAHKLNKQEIKQQETNHEIGIVPMAIPLLSGPGAISVSIIHAKSFTGIEQWSIALIGVIIIALIVKFALLSSEKIGKKMGTLGLNVLTRVMGIILLSMSIEMIASGVIKELLPVLR